MRDLVLRVSSNDADDLLFQYPSIELRQGLFGFVLVLSCLMFIFACYGTLKTKNAVARLQLGLASGTFLASFILAVVLACTTVETGEKGVLIPILFCILIVLCLISLGAQTLQLRRAGLKFLIMENIADNTLLSAFNSTTSKHLEQGLIVLFCLALSGMILCGAILFPLAPDSTNVVPYWEGGPAWSRYFMWDLMIMLNFVTMSILCIGGFISLYAVRASLVGNVRSLGKTDPKLIGLIHKFTFGGIAGALLALASFAFYAAFLHVVGWGPNIYVLYLVMMSGLSLGGWILFLYQPSSGLHIRDRVVKCLTGKEPVLLATAATGTNYNYVSSAKNHAMVSGSA